MPGQPPTLARPDTDLAGTSALIIDGSATVRSLLLSYLTDWGMTADLADSAEMATALLRSAGAEGRSYAVVLLARTLPGVETLAMRALADGIPGVGTTVILMTGVGRDRRADDDVAFGARASLPKPIHRDRLRACLRSALGLAQLDPEIAEKVTFEASSADNQRTGHVLLVEDNLINQKIVLAMLSASGYRVDTALNGEKAIEALTSQPYDAILMDCQMPIVNGYEATEAIRVKEAGGHRTPIIALTASARREDQERCFAAGMDHYLTKPITKDALLAVIAQSLTPAGQRS